MKSIGVSNRLNLHSPLVLLLLVASGPAYSDGILWTNPAGGNWSAAANWRPNQVPGAADTAFIGTEGNYTVTNDQNTTVTSLYVGASLWGAQNLRVAAGATLTSTLSSSVERNGSLMVAVGGCLNPGTLFGTLDAHGPVTNAGTINLTNSSIYLLNDGTAWETGGLLNQAGGQINLYGSGGISSLYGLNPKDYFVNQGTVTKAAGTGTSAIIASQGVLAGAYHAAAGTTIRLGGGTSSSPLQADPSLVLNGPGQYEFNSGYLSYPVEVMPGLALTGGTLLLGPGFEGGSITNLGFGGMTLTNTLPVTGTLSVTNSVVFGSITVSNGGRCNVNDSCLNAQVTVQGGGKLLMDGRWRVAIGDGSVTNSWLTVQSGAELDVNTYLDTFGPVTNAGLINVSNEFSLFTGNDGSGAYAGGIMNLGTGVIDLWNGSSLYGVYGHDYLINQGAINVMSGSSSVIRFNHLNLEAGTITTQPGTGTLEVGKFSGLEALTGTYHAATNTIIQFTASDAPGTSAGTPLVLGGTGEYQFVQGLLTLPLNPIPNVSLTGGTLLLEPGFEGGSITNLGLNGITLTNPLPVTGTLNVTNGAVFGSLRVSNGGMCNVNGSQLNAQVTVQGGGKLLMSGGAASIGFGFGWVTNSWLTVLSGGELDLNTKLYLYGPVTNAGLINVKNGSTLYSYNDGSALYAGGIMNLGTGVIDLWNSSSLYGPDSGNEYLINQGTINVMSGSSNTINSSNLNLGAGTVTTQPGTGTFRLGKFSGMGALTGTYDAATNTIIQFAASAAPGTSTGTPLVLGGAGQYQFVQGLLTLPLNPIPNVGLRGGSLLLGSGFEGGSITNLALGGITLTNTLPVTGTLSVTKGAVYGSIVVSNGAVFSANNAYLNAQVTVQAGGRCLVSNGAYLGNGSVTNSWLTVFSGGELDLDNSLYAYGPVTNAGLINVTNGSSLYTYNNGKAACAGGVVNLATGVIELWKSASLYGKDFGNEYLINQGTISLVGGAGSGLLYFNYLANQAILSAQQGTLQLRSPHLDLQSSGTLEVGLNGPMDYGKFSINGSAPLKGTFGVTLNNGYTPAAGYSFPLLAYVSSTDQFTTFRLPALLPNVVWQPLYGSTALTLVTKPPIVCLPSRTNVVVSINGIPTRQAILLMSTNVMLPLIDWKPVATNTFGATTYLGLTNSINSNAPQQFFTFQLP